jgi:hypothetical protein
MQLSGLLAKSEKGEKMNYSSSTVAENALIALNEELKTFISSLGILEKEMNLLKRQMLDIRIQQSPLVEAIRMAKQNISTKRIEIDLTTKSFWQLKKDGL